MAYDPPFMQQLEIYYAQADALRTVDEWNAYEKRWFVYSQWPSRRPPRPDDAGGDRLLRQDARRWSKTFHVYDLTQEARYHYNVVWLGVGMAIRFPHLGATSERGWTQHCAYCEISTDDAGDEPCPICARALLHEYVED